MKNKKIVRIGLSGTPGSGKTAASKFIEESQKSRADEINKINKTYEIDIFYLTEFIKDQNVSSTFDNERSCLVVDMDDLEIKIQEYEKKLKDLDSLSESEITFLIIESHMSHLLCDISIILRIDPEILYSRLTKRGYSKGKVEENCEAETLDVILCEAFDLCDVVFEIDTTNKSLENVSESVLDIISLIYENQDLFLTKNTSTNDASIYDFPVFPDEYKPGKANWLG